jgi:hypothetical protein
MDLNQLLYHHQIALIRFSSDAAGDLERGSKLDLVRHYETRIARLRQDMGVAAYPQWA